MIKTLRITSIVVGVLAAILLVLPAFFGVRGDEEIENLLKSAGAADRFLAEKGKRPARDESQSSPLVKQAAAFGLILNPPPPPPPKPAPGTGRITAERPAPPVVTPKFNLVGTSYYADRPELSLALIDEPGKGYNWVRQGGTVGHLTIEQVKDGSITIKDGRGSSEMTVKIDQPWRSLLKNPPPEARPIDTSVPVSAAPASPVALPPAGPSSLRSAEAGRRRPGFGAKVPPSRISPPAVAAQPVPLPAQVPENTELTGEDPEIDAASPEIQAQQTRLNEFIKAMPEEPTVEEIEKLAELAEKLEQMQAAEREARQQSKESNQANSNSDTNQ